MSCLSLCLSGHWRPALPEGTAACNELPPGNDCMRVPPRPFGIGNAPHIFFAPTPLQKQPRPAWVQSIPTVFFPGAVVSYTPLLTAAPQLSRLSIWRMPKMKDNTGDLKHLGRVRIPRAGFGRRRVYGGGGRRVRTICIFFPLSNLKNFTFLQIIVQNMCCTMRNFLVRR